MNLLVIVLAGWSIFATVNSDFLSKVEEQKSKGYEWVYTGKQVWVDRGDNPAILLESYKGTKPYTLFKLQFKK